MKKYLFFLIAIALMASCKKTSTAPSNPHVAGANCGKCHTQEQTEWASSTDLHALPVDKVLTNPEHNSTELLINDCIKCHSTFQEPLGIAYFVTPLDTIGNPPGTWTALHANVWQATKCEVCHNPASNDSLKLAKYGSELDGPWHAGYINLSTLPAAYQVVRSLTTGQTWKYYYPDQNSLPVLEMKLCNSCHDPADEGDEPSMSLDGINCGPQGGDGRVYVASNHQGFTCTDCHTPHTFAPVDPTKKQECLVCHSTPRTGKVHLNHLGD